MNCIVQIRILWFFLLSEASLPYNRILISLSWLSDGRDLSMFIKSFIRISRIPLKNWHHRKKCNVFSASMLPEHNGFKVSSKLCQNFCSRKWLSPNLNLVSNFIPTWSWMLKILFSLGLIKFSRALQIFRKIDTPFIGIKFVPLPYDVKKVKKEFWKYSVLQ